MPAPTTYKPVTYETKGTGTLKLYDNQLTFQMFDINAANNTRIFTLPWGKVKKRQVINSGQSAEPKCKLILKSGNEAIFRFEDRISLEVCRDDIGERLSKYKAQYPDSDDEAVNKTKVSSQRESQPYRLAKPTAPKAEERKPQPYRMAKPAPKAEERKSQPYRMAKKEPETKRQSQPYRYVAK